MPHWRQEAKENARLVRNTKELLEALEALVETIYNVGGSDGSELRRAEAIIAKVKANSTEPVE